MERRGLSALGAKTVVAGGGVHQDQVHAFCGGRQTGKGGAGQVRDEEPNAGGVRFAEIRDQRGDIPRLSANEPELDACCNGVEPDLIEGDLCAGVRPTEKVRKKPGVVSAFGMATLKKIAANPRPGLAPGGAPPGAVFHYTVVPNGMSRNRLPVAWNSALPMAGAIGGTPGSPAPEA